MNTTDEPPVITHEWISAAYALPRPGIVVYGIRFYKQGNRNMETKLGMVRRVGGHWYGASGTPSATPTHWRFVKPQGGKNEQ